VQKCLLALYLQLLWSNIFVTLVAKKIVDYCRSSIELAGFHQGFSLCTAETDISLNESIIPDYDVRTTQSGVLLL